MLAIFGSASSCIEVLSWNNVYISQEFEFYKMIMGWDKITDQGNA